ncbi:MAG: transporter substrate-binding domain-containing protein [Magnetococcales bacterium]|nr:transporter substrate-binding domain-containing protein [Magnetococcales bacterium]
MNLKLLALPILLFTVFTTTVAFGQNLTPLPLATVEFPPFHYKTGSEVTGFLTQIVKITFKRIGYDAKIDIYPSKRGKNLAERGEIAGIFAFTKNQDRLNKYHFTLPLGHVRDVFFKRKTSDISWEKLEDLKPYIVGATATYNYAPVFLQAIEKGVLKSEMVVSPTPEVIHLRKLVGKRIDIAICEITLCNFIINNNNKEFNTLDYINKEIGDVRTFHLGISRKWSGGEELTRKFNAALLELEKEGVIAQIYDSFGIVPYEE